MNTKSHEARKKNSKFWIADALKNATPGALHRELGVPMGKKIPVGKLDSASKGNSKKAKQARLALTLRSLHH